MSNGPVKYSMEDPAESWHALEHFLTQIHFRNGDVRSSPDFAPTVYVIDWTREEDWICTADKIRQAERPHLAQFEVALAMILNSGDPYAEEFEQEVLEILWKRSDVAAWFVNQQIVNDVALTTGPDCSHRSAVEWLMIDWWDRHGATLEALFMRA